MAYFNAPDGTIARNGVFTTIAVFLLSTWLTMGLRLWVRIVMVRSFGWDDGLLLVAVISFSAFCTMIVLADTVYGANHPNELDFPELARLMGVVISCFGLYLGSMIFFKISLGIFYLRFVIQPWQRYAVHAMIYMNTFYGSVLFFVAIFNCGNPTKYLENELKLACMGPDTLYGIQVFGSVINAITDWAFAVLPVFVLAKAPWPLATKLSAGVILCLACGGSIVSLVRIPYIHGISAGPNFFNTVLDLCILSTVEIGLGLSAAAAATLRPLFVSRVDKTNTFTETTTFGSRARNTAGSMNKHRVSDALFGDWKTVEQREHEMQDIERGGRRSYFRLTPAFSNSRVMGTLGLASGPRPITASLSNPSTMNSTMPSTTTTTTTTTSTTGSTSPLMKPQSKRVPRQKSIGTMRSEFTRQQRIKEQHISRPIPHIVGEMAPPPVPIPERSQEKVYRVDRRRMGSEDWTKNASLSRPGYFEAVGNNPASSQSIDRPTTSRGPRMDGASPFNEGGPLYHRGRSPYHAGGFSFPGTPHHEGGSPNHGAPHHEGGPPNHEAPYHQGGPLYNRTPYYEGGFTNQEATYHEAGPPYHEGGAPYHEGGFPFPEGGAPYHEGGFPFPEEGSMF